LDLAYPRLRVVVEYDGEDFHDRTEEQRRHDAERRAWLEEHDWTVVVVKKGDFTGAGLDRWLGELRRALRPTYSNRRW
jgi:very-short-patch-repair endonuclease